LTTYHDYAIPCSGTQYMLGYRLYEVICML
jgi:hypothetical protein